MASIWIKTGRRGRPVSITGRTLANELGLPINVESDIIIRWGSTEPVPFGDRLTINPEVAIRLASDKPRARQVLRDAGLSVPVDNEMDFPIVARARRHHAGSGFWLCNDWDDLADAKEQGAVYFSQFYPKTREIRVHVAGGRAILVSEKEGGDRSLPVWNHSRSSFQLRHLHRSVWLNDSTVMKAVREARKAVTALGLDFGAVDIMLAPTDGQAAHVICEVNTAPALSPLAVSKYVKYFEGVINGLA